MLGVGVRLHNVLALAVQTQKAAAQRCFKHIGNAQTRLWVEPHAPCAFKLGTRNAVRDMAVARQLMRKAAHVAAALHIVLATQWVHAHAFAAHIARGHGQIGNAHDHG